MTIALTSRPQMPVVAFRRGIAIRPIASAVAMCACASLVAGCARYTPLPLPDAAALASSVDALPVQQPQPGPLTADAIVALALANNPDLKAIRARSAVAAGQSRQASLLPNPSLSAAFLPLLSGQGTVPAWNIGLSQDIKALVTYKSRQRAARDSEDQVAADVVWQEWQVAGRARQLTSDIVMGERLRSLETDYYALLKDRNARLSRALAARTVTLATVAPERVALQAARTGLDTLEQNQLSLRHQLNALLGLRSDAVLNLSPETALPPFDPAAVEAGLPDLVNRRPDLLALRLGYAAADENVRQAILSQFPDLVFGGSVASDNAKVINGGPNVTLGLPIFDHGQGAIAIARATRAQLHAEYAARLAATTGEVAAMLSETRQLADQLAVARSDLAPVRSAAAKGQIVFTAGHLDERGYLDLVGNMYAREQDIITMETALRDRQIAIQTLVGAGLPTVDLPLEPAPVQAKGGGK